jgi:hypothetical protein
MAMKVRAATRPDDLTALGRHGASIARMRGSPLPSGFQRLTCRSASFIAFDHAPPGRE